MNKEETLKEIYQIIDEICVFKLKPFEKFYAEHKGKSERELGQMLSLIKKCKQSSLPKKKFS